MSELLSEAYARVTSAVQDLTEDDLARPTRTEWSVAELLWHQGIDATRALAAFATPTTAEPDVDAVTYWRAFHPAEGDGGAAHAAHVRRAAAAFATRRGVVGWWLLVGPACARAAAAAPYDGRVETQGHVLDVADLCSTLVVEATVHLLDLVVDLPGAPGPAPAALAETRRVLEALNGEPLAGDDLSVVLRGTGRAPGGPVLLG